MAKATSIGGLSAHARLRKAGPGVLAARLRDVQAQEAGLPSEGPVHDMRVAIRRLRAALRLLRLPDAEVKKLQDALGAVRDLQLQIAWLPGRDDRLAARRKALLPRAQRKLDAALAHWRAETLPALLAPAGPRGRLADGHARKLLRKRLKRLEHRIDAARERPTPAPMHAVRRSVKQLRYLFELVRPAFPSLSKSLLSDLTPVQVALGELHDADVRMALMQRGRLLREQKEDRARLVRIVLAELARWKKQEILPSARRALR